ncbi:LamG domain-containing protein [Verrucomicrobiaceae bacterium 227]
MSNLYTQLLSAASATALLTSSAGAALIGHWAFDEGSGATAADSSGLGNDGTITGATWGSDATRANYIVMSGAAGSVVDPNVTLPAMTSTNNFTWAFWANSQEGINGVQQNAVIIGNRKNGANGEYSPRQFIKFTPTKFEWHQNSGTINDNQEYDDLVVGEWHHHAVVKTGLSLQYYRDGIAVGGPGTVTESELSGAVAMRFFIGGDVNNPSVNEFFNGYIDDVRIYDDALSAGDVNALAVPEPSALLLGALSLGMMIRRKR